MQGFIQNISLGMGGGGGGGGGNWAHIKLKPHV